MTDDFKLDAEEFFRSALDLIPVVALIRRVKSTADSSSAALGTPWGNDELGAAFAFDYQRMRSSILSNTGSVADNVDSLHTSYVEARDEFVETDDDNGELVAIIGREITTESGDKITPTAGHGITFDGGHTTETPEDIAEDLNQLDDAEEDATDDAEARFD